MKLLILLFLLLPIYSFSNGTPDFVVETKNGYWYITHIVLKGESIDQLSKEFSVKPSVLANINNLSSQSPLTPNQPVLIPLTETNYFKMAGITAGQIW